jgi:prophage DNA circulation protein
MSWKDNLLPGSYRGVPFFIENHSSTGGRRTQVHEFVDRDTPFSEDLGRKARSFSLSIHLIGDDYFQQRDRMISALEQRGAGELIHPYLGQIDVNVDGYSFTEDTQEGRIVRFTISFTEAGSNIYPSIEEDRAQTLLDFAEQSLVSAQENFENGFSVLGQPGFVVDSATALVEQAADAFDAATSAIPEATQTITDLTFKIRNLKADALELVQQPSLLAENLLSAIQDLSAVATNADDASASFSTLFNFGDDQEELAPFETESRERERLNKQNFNNYIKNMAVILATEETIDRNFFSTEAAITEQQNLKELINRQADTAEDINFFQNMNDLAAALVAAVPSVDDELSNVITFVPQNTTNSIILAYDLFEDIEREQEIIDRNSIRHPGFIVGGTELEVLNA